MLQHWLIKKNRKKLIVFFCGWGNDFHPFTTIESDQYDVFMVYAYHQPETVDWKNVFAGYDHKCLIAWSMGVLQAAKHLHNFADEYLQSVAINGSLTPVDDQFGIPHVGYQLTIDSFSEQARRKFYQRMCKSRAVLSRYLSSAPERDAEDQKEELVFHQNESKAGQNCAADSFSHVIIGTDDLIFPPENLRNFWAGKAQLSELGLPHFVFYDFEKWDGIIFLLD